MRHHFANDVTLMPSAEVVLAVAEALPCLISPFVGSTNSSARAPSSLNASNAAQVLRRQRQAAKRGSAPTKLRLAASQLQPQEVLTRCFFPRCFDEHLPYERGVLSRAFAGPSPIKGSRLSWSISARAAVGLH